jgi:hypothetical protein
VLLMDILFILIRLRYNNTDELLNSFNVWRYVAETRGVNTLFSALDLWSEANILLSLDHNISPHILSALVILTIFTSIYYNTE